MRIEFIDLYKVRMPLVYPFRTAYGSDEVIEAVLVRLGSGERSGWGESQPFAAPCYSPEFAAGVFEVLRDWLAPALVGQEVGSGAELATRLAPFKGNYFAKGGLDMAWWDLHARMQGRPLWQVLGGKGPTVTVGADFGVMESFDLLLGKIDEALARGFKRVKLKYAPGWDLPMVAAVRKAFPKGVFHIDCNSAYRLSDLPMFKALDQYGLAMIEQPLMHDDLIDDAKLAAAISTPVCLDESITGVDKARKAIELKACGWVNIKPVRVGGLTNALEINRLCADAGVPCWVGGMLESAVGASHCLAMATLDNMQYPNDVFPSSRFYTRDLGQPEIVLSGPSQITAQPGPGIGVEPDPERLREMTVEHVHLEARG